MRKLLLITIVGMLTLLQAPFTMSEETVTITVKELNALKSLCSSLKETDIKTTNKEADKPTEPDIGNVVKIASLRGFHDLDKEAKAIERKKQLKVSGGVEKNWDLQPPSIPHSIEKDSITLKGNTCMRCHSKANHEKEKAPVIGKSHYKTRDGKILEKVSTRRWFCLQCHTPQADAKPLVENTF